MHFARAIEDSLHGPALRDRLSDLLDEARSRTFEVIEPLAADDLFQQHDRLMSPIIWDVGHIGNFEELWGVRPFHDNVRPEYDAMYDAMKVPRAIRDKLPLPALSIVMEYLSTVRGRVSEYLRRADLDSSDPLVHDGYVWQMILQHEYQHNETILQTLQLKGGEPYSPVRRRPLPKGNGAVTGMTRVPAGEFLMGTDDRSAAYDNERYRHAVYVPEFLIDVSPVSNGDYLKFVEAGGYERQEFWDPAGWEFITGQGIHAPKHWNQSLDGTWTTRSMNQSEPLNERRPVCHVCWYEADAFARYVGKRLPTETEWEKAAAWNPITGDSLAYPWGNDPPSRDRANLDQRGWMAAEIGAYPAGVSPVGCHQMIGDVWEWTASDFLPYPGFAAFPYAEYSEVFFGPEYKVLRGGSWATRPGAIRNTFRNWDYPIRRQIFAGFRCAMDPDTGD